MKVLNNDEIINEDNIEEFLKNNEIVLIDYYADWCGPCKKLLPLLECISKNYKNIKIIKINIDDYEDFTKKKNVKSLPTIHFHHKGDIYHKEEGVREGGKYIIITIANLLAREHFLLNKINNDNNDNNDRDNEYKKLVKKLSNEISMKYLDYLDDNE